MRIRVSDVWPAQNCFQLRKVSYGGPRSTKICFTGYATPDRCSQMTGIAAVFHLTRYVTLLTTIPYMASYDEVYHTVPATFYEPRTKHASPSDLPRQYTTYYQHASRFAQYANKHADVLQHVTCMLQQIYHNHTSTVWSMWIRLFCTYYSNSPPAASLMVRSQPIFANPKSFCDECIIFQFCYSKRTCGQHLPSLPV